MNPLARCHRYVPDRQDASPKVMLLYQKGKAKSRVSKTKRSVSAELVFFALSAIAFKNFTMQKITSAIKRKSYHSSPNCAVLPRQLMLWSVIWIWSLNLAMYIQFVHNFTESIRISGFFDQLHERHK